MARVILIEDDPLVRTLLMRRLTAAGWGVIALRDGRDLDAIVGAQKGGLLVVDLGLPHMDGLALIDHLRGRAIDTPVLVITAHELPHLLDTVRSSGANDL